MTPCCSTNPSQDDKSASTSTASPAAIENKSSTEASLSTGTSPDGMLEVHSYLPDGIQVGSGPFGRCLLATKHFPKGSLMYRAYAALVKMPEQQQQPVSLQHQQDSKGDDSVLTTSSVSSESSGPLKNEFLLHLYSADGKLMESTVLDELNSVQDIVNPSENRRQVYGFDGFMNHSCSPNCYCPLVSRAPDLMTYNAVAEKDIFPGDEITCDYALFDYECDGHEIVACGCQAADCRGKMMGFKALPLEEKVRILHQAEDEIVQQFLADNPSIQILNSSQLPPGVALVNDNANTKSLVATRQFENGEIVYTNQATIIPKDQLADTTYICHVDGRYILLNAADHFIHRPTYAEFVGFDSFQDHSCEPNTSQQYQDEVTYTVRATRTIAVGETLTVDYGGLENQANAIEHVPSSSFSCQCGSTLCRGIIVA